MIPRDSPGRHVFMSLWPHYIKLILFYGMIISTPVFMILSFLKICRFNLTAAINLLL